ncbi:MAG TPA: hypothetical protein DCS93_33380 [Microscillaceae bacterium]|nr:hypothetical protein [Microscillaceae bacterium]
MGDYLYKKEVEYVPFQSRVWAKASLLVYLMGIQFIILLVIALALNLPFVLIALPVVAIGLGANYIIFWRRMRYFLQGIQISQNKTVHLDLYLKDENQRIQLPLHYFQIKFQRTGGKGRYILLRFYNQQQLLGFQYDFKVWNHDSLAEVFTAIKAIKEEELTKQEKRMLKKGFFG